MVKLSPKDHRRLRVIQDFVKAAQEIIETEGIEGISARKVADKAGWSYATIYNYFQDINHLLWHCVPFYFTELNKLIEAETAEIEDPKEQVSSGFKVYIKYFLCRPNIYRFLFMTDLGAPPEEVEIKKATIHLNNTLRNQLVRCVKQGTVDQEQAPILGELLKNAVLGSLFLQATGKSPYNPQELINRVDKYVDYLFKRKVEK